MKLTIQTKPLVAALASLKAIAKPSTTHPILSNVLMIADKNTLTLTATDMEKQMSISLDCRVSKKGSTTLSISKLHDSLSKARSPELTIEVTDTHQATIRAGSATTRILGLPPEEMPATISIENGNSITISAPVLASCLQKSLLHASVDKTRPQFNSVFFSSKDGKFRVLASCGRRGAICDTDVIFDSKESYIVPRESIPAMIGICTEGNAEIILSEGALMVTTATGSFATKLIEGRMPNFDAVFAQECPRKMTTNREDLMAIVEYAEVQTTERSRYITLACDGSQITARGAGQFIDSENGAFVDMNEDAIKCASGSDVVSLLVNPQFLRDSLKSLESEDVTIEFSDSKSPFLMRDIGITTMICPLNPAALTSKTETK